MTDRMTEYRWLISAQAARLLDDTVRQLAAGKNVLSVNKSLRKSTSPERAALILEMAQLRLRGLRKFPLAEQMFFTRRALEMASDDLIASFKARRFASFGNIADICCSIGGDLMALARSNPKASVVGFDIDELAVMYANRNLGVINGSNGSARVNALTAVRAREFQAIHFDPDRRARGRTVRTDSFSPTLTEILACAKSCDALGIKVAPATVILDRRFERQWIGHHRECQQQVLWSGELATHPNCRVATRLEKSGDVTEFVCSEASFAAHRPAIAQTIQRYLYEPHSVLLASALAGAMAFELDLQRLAPGIVYFTSDVSVANKLFARFQVLESMPAQTGKVVSALQRHDIGQLEVKKRGVPDHLVERFKRIRLTGSVAGTILLTAFQNRATAIIAIRD